MKIEVVILTKSSKFGGYCVAGVDRDTGEWVRFVSNNDQTHSALSKYDISYSDGSICKPLDIVLVDVKRAVPLAHQPENYLIDSTMWWEKVGECTLSNVLNLHPAEIRPYIYGNPDPFVEAEKINGINYSLTLVMVSSLSITHIAKYDKTKTKASFFYNGNWYTNMSVTDPDYYSIPNGTKYNQAYLVISIPNTPFQDNRYYKFVAQIFPQ